MEVIDYLKGFMRGRRGNTIYFVLNGKLYAKQYTTPGKKRKWEVEGRTLKQKEITTRFTAVQCLYKEYMKQISPTIWRTAAKALGKIAPNLFNTMNFHCFDGNGNITDFKRFAFTTGKLALPRNLQVTQEGNRFQVTWQEEREWITAARTDRMQVGVLYDQLQRSPRLVPEVMGCRGDLQGEFTLDEALGQTAHVYIYFAGINEIDFSPSWYTHVEYV